MRQHLTRPLSSQNASANPAKALALCTKRGEPGCTLQSINDYADIRRVFEGFHFETLNIWYTTSKPRRSNAEISGELVIMNWERADPGGLFNYQGVNPGQLGAQSCNSSLSLIRSSTIVVKRRTIFIFRSRKETCRAELRGARGCGVVLYLS
ncbi:hypothetical protein [Pseudomonas sp. LPH60]|uniref:hypothetical protein n=1 Tax=Pseudomonas sp. LPH60 TaxID=3065906 RepID=UPI0035300850